MAVTMDPKPNKLAENVILKFKNLKVTLKLVAMRYYDSFNLFSGFDSREALHVLEWPQQKVKNTSLVFLRSKIKLSMAEYEWKFIVRCFPEANMLSFLERGRLTQMFSLRKLQWRKNLAQIVKHHLFPRRWIILCALLIYYFRSEGFSEEGCHVVKSKSNSEETVCSCNHLTHFAVLMDYDGSLKVIK